MKKSIHGYIQELKDTHKKDLRFYNAVNNCVFTYWGEADGVRPATWYQLVALAPKWRVL